MSQGQITVVGSYVTDLMSRTPHMPKPGETVLGGPFKMGPGGKGGNQAIAASRQGSRVYLVTKVGNDQFGQDALAYFNREQIETSYIYVDPEETTGIALIAVDDQSENMIVVAPGACGKLQADDVIRAEQAIAQSAIVLTQLETSLEAVTTTVQLAQKHGVPVLLNPAPYRAVPAELLAQVTYLTPNETEAAQLTGIEVKDEQTACQAAFALYHLGVPHVIITLGQKGCYYYAGGETGRLFPAYDVDVLDTTGAGDAFNGGLAHALAAGQPMEEAIRFAHAVAGLCVTREGTAPAMPTSEEVTRFLARK